ncbi:hypothetical protein MUG91_G169n6 [Manis pentadactyla]|nr:hypothetical protein MUG91_G169n6 [Manis pentadactyla]
MVGGFPWFYDIKLLIASTENQVRKEYFEENNSFQIKDELILENRKSKEIYGKGSLSLPSIIIFITITIAFTITIITISIISTIITIIIIANTVASNENQTLNEDFDSDLKVMQQAVEEIITQDILNIPL